MKLLGLLAVALFVVVIPIFLISSSVRWVINAPLLYSYGFDKYDISSKTGIERDELIGVGRQFRDYFVDDEEYLDLRVVQNGVRRDLLNSKEILHMRDVKALVRGVFRIQEGIAAYLAAFVVLGFIAFGRGFVRPLGRYAALGGAATIALVVVAGVGALAGFDRLFILFHQLGFSNNLWQLDPRTDYLVVLFPEGFFFDATMWIAGSTVVEALILVALPLAIGRWHTEPSEDTVPAVSAAARPAESDAVS